MGLHRWLPNVKRMGFIIFMATLFAFPLENLLAIQGEVAYKMTNSMLQEKFYKTRIDQKIDVEIREATVEDALRQIANRTGLKLTYRGDVMEKKTINIIEEGIEVTDALNSILEGTELDYLFSEDGYLLVYASRDDLTDIEVQQNIRGTVTDAETGEPLPGVNVVVAGSDEATGSTIGTTTDIEGNYEIQVPEGLNTLVFTFVGYQTQEIQINGRSEINVELATEAIIGDELVVIGYGSVRKSDLTGSVSSVGSDDFNQGIQSSLDQMIQSRVPGLNITQANSEPGGGVSVRIRGTTSITAGNEPLYVIDGQPIDNDPSGLPSSSLINEQSPRNPLKALNPNDIESIEVLKDASAAAIYGSRGANGVIMITTKRGQAGALQINYNGEVGFQKAIQNLDFLDAQEYMTFVNDIREDGGETPLFSQDEINSSGAGTDWMQEILRTAPSQNHQLSFSGGNENFTFNSSLNFFDQEGVILSSGTRRFSGRVNLDYSKGRFNAGLSLNTSFLEDDYIPNGLGANLGAGVVPSAQQMDPLMSIRDEFGNFTESNVIEIENPVALAEASFDEAETNRTFGNVFGEYEFTDNFSAMVRFGSDRQVSRRDGLLPLVLRRGQTRGGPATIEEQERTNYLLETTLNYDNQFGQNHSLNAVVGFTTQTFNGRGFRAQSAEFPVDAFITDNLGAGSRDRNEVGSNRFKNRLLSYLGRANYTLMDRYLLTTSIRVDGSTRFGEGNKYGVFPSFALAWRLSDEPFLNNSNLFTDLKLRTSYGVTGNQNIGNNQSLLLLSAVDNFGNPIEAIFNDNLVNGVRPAQLGNPDLKWETTNQFDIGLDFSLFDDRITGSVDYFIKKTSDLLLELPIPSTSGFAFSLQNVGDTENRGFELFIDTNNLTTTDFNWSTTLNIATLSNKVTDLGGLDQILEGQMRFISDFTILREGDPINSYFGYVADGIIQEGEVAGSAQPNANPGDIKFRDLNGDGMINPEDRTILGDPIPDVTLGFNNSFFYKGWGLDVFFEGKFGFQLLDFTRIDSENPISDLRNRQDYVINRWTPENPTSENPSFVNQTSRERAINTRVVDDASFVRLKNLRFSYNFPNLNLSGLRSLSIYGSAQNVLTFTDYKGDNPDVNALGDSNIVADFAAFPLSRIYSLGINIGL